MKIIVRFMFRNHLMKIIQELIQHMILFTTTCLGCEKERI